MFRVYADANGNPAGLFSKQCSITTKTLFTCKTLEVKENDQAMILGYPGRTNR